MSFEILLLVVVILGFIVIYFSMKKFLVDQKSKQIEDVVDRVFGMSAKKIAEQSRQILQSDKEAIKVDLQNKQMVMEKLVQQLRDEMSVHQKEIRSVEKDRVREFGELAKSLDHYRELTGELKASTDTLAKVLSNNQQRGEWGERIIEDIMVSNGLVEGVHFLKQKKLGNTALKPDITILLPNDRVVPVDVKFPYSEMQKLSVAETKSAKQAHLKQFEQDLKTKINRVAEYINPAQNTLDYAIMFVPNEAVFSFVNQTLPHIVDMAMGKRVLIVSPFTFLIVARTVMESYRNFMIGDKLKEVVRYIDDFVGEGDKFKMGFEKYGRTLVTLQKDYEDLTGTRVRVMEKKITKVKSYSSGSLIDGKDSAKKK